MVSISFQTFVQQHLNALKEELAVYNFSLEVSRKGVIALGDFYTQAYQSGTFFTDYFLKFSMHLPLFIGEAYRLVNGGIWMYDSSDNADHPYNPTGIRCRSTRIATSFRVRLWNIINPEELVYAQELPLINSYMAIEKECGGPYRDY